MSVDPSMSAAGNVAASAAGGRPVDSAGSPSWYGWSRSSAAVTRLPLLSVISYRTSEIFSLIVQGPVQGRTNFLPVCADSWGE